MKKITLLLGITFFMACGEEAKKEVKSKENITEQLEEKERIEIKVEAVGDDMAKIAFEPSTISVPSNSRIILTLENKSTAAGMLHNFVLVELGSGSEISSKGIKAGLNNSFVPNDKRVIAYTKVSNMGETVSVEFDAPAKGSYHYICTYPGHLNMVGRFNVE